MPTAHAAATGDAAVDCHCWAVTPHAGHIVPTVSSCCCAFAPDNAASGSQRRERRVSPSHIEPFFATLRYTPAPVGAIALYDALEQLGAEPWLACGAPLSKCLIDDYRVLELNAKNLVTAQQEAQAKLEQLQPQAIISIERPGLSADGCYYNMRGEDITPRSAFFDPYLTNARCPTMAIGDGGNEIGMGNIRDAIATLDINAAVTKCDELLVADVSNWGAYGLIAFLGYWRGRDMLGEISPLDILNYLSARGSVDGVTRESTLTEDGLQAEEGQNVIDKLRSLTGFQ